MRADASLNTAKWLGRAFRSGYYGFEVFELVEEVLNEVPVAVRERTEGRDVDQS